MLQPPPLSHPACLAGPVRAVKALRRLSRDEAHCRPGQEQSLHGLLQSEVPYWMRDKAASCPLRGGVVYCLVHGEACRQP